MSDNSIDMCQIVSDFRAWGGKNYRIEKNDPIEGRMYGELKAADTGTDSSSVGAITLPEYLKYIKQTQASLNISPRDTYMALDIDILFNRYDQRYYDVAWDLARADASSAVPILLEAFYDTVDKDKQFRIARALGVCGNEIAIPLLTRLIKTEYRTRPIDIAVALYNVMRCLPGSAKDQKAAIAKTLDEAGYDGEGCSELKMLNLFMRFRTALGMY